MSFEHPGSLNHSEAAPQGVPPSEVPNQTRTAPEHTLSPEDDIEEWDLPKRALRWIRSSDPDPEVEAFLNGLVSHRERTAAEEAFLNSAESIRDSEVTERVDKWLISPDPDLALEAFLKDDAHENEAARRFAWLLVEHGTLTEEQCRAKLERIRIPSSPAA